jgi:hypothetical protein
LLSDKRGTAFAQEMLPTPSLKQLVEERFSACDSSKHNQTKKMNKNNLYFKVADYIFDSCNK